MTCCVSKLRIGCRKKVFCNWSSEALADLTPFWITILYGRHYSKFVSGLLFKN